MALLFIAVAVATHGIVAADASGSASSSSELLGPFPDDLNWTNANGGPLPPQRDPFALLARQRPAAANRRPSPAPLSSPFPPVLHPLSSTMITYAYQPGLWDNGNDLHEIQVANLQGAFDACTAVQLCRGFTYNNSAGGPNGTITANTTVYLKKTGTCAGRRGVCGVTGGVPWATWLKGAAPPGAPATVVKAGGLTLALREHTFTAQWLNLSDGAHTNYSFVPPLTAGSALPLVHHLGDITLRVRLAGGTGTGGDGGGGGGGGGGSYDYFSSSFAPGVATAVPAATLRPGELAAHDITPLLAATRLATLPGGGVAPPETLPLSVRRAYVDVDGALGVAFEVTNTGGAAVELGALGMSVPAAVSQDAHIGGDHGWVEWLRVHVNDALELDQSCVVAAPLVQRDGNGTKSGGRGGGFEAYRPILEFGGGGFEVTAHSRAWADEWRHNQQWPFLYMDYALNATGMWPAPRSPWPSWGAGGQTVRTNVTDASHWNPPTSRVLQPGERATYGLRFKACTGGARTRDGALAAAGEPVLRTVPGTTLPADLEDGGRIFVELPSSNSRGGGGAPGLRATGATSSNPSVVTAGTPSAATTTAAAASKGGASTVIVPVKPVSPGQARVEISFSDGTTAVVHYLVLPALPQQIKSVATHWSEVAWLPRDFKDPFGRSASVMPYDREDGRRRLNDARAYDVGLSDDAGAANNLGLATSQAYAPFQSAVGRVDEYVAATLLGLKNDTAEPPLRSLQIPETFRVRMSMFYYQQLPVPPNGTGGFNSSGNGNFDWNYTQVRECSNSSYVAGGLNYNWCMTESRAMATYRGFNYPHQIAVYYALYRVARNHPRLKTLQPWDFYLGMAANTTLALGFARIGYMDGTVTREVLRSVLEEAGEVAAGAAAAGATNWTALGQQILAGEKQRADYFRTAPNPYGSEFSYDTTGQEEVVVWQLYFGYDDDAARTVDHILQYMRPLPNWAYNGGAVAGDVMNGGKWFVTAGTGRGDFGKMHYRAGLNQIPLAEWYRRHPDDRTALEVSVGAQSGQMGNIDVKSGAPSIYYHAYPHIMEFDAYSGDYGLGFFGSSLEAGATLVVDADLGPLCYLCDLTVKFADAGSGGGGGGSSSSVYQVRPRDAYRQRVYLEPLGVYLQADAGNFASVELDLSARQIQVSFTDPAVTPAGVQSYDVLRLRCDKVSQPDAKRPGHNFRVSSPTTKVVKSRGAFEIPADGRSTSTSKNAATVTVTIEYDV